MWLLLTVASLISVLGTTHGFLGESHDESPEASMNISQMISYWGYPSEVYEVTTEDGYVLTVNRIPYGKKNSENIGHRPIAYLQHGFIASATNWVTNLPNNSLGFILADAGYDVWMGNSRGNTWSRKNIFFSPDTTEFWAFSFDEMAKYDLPATIDFILQKTGQEQINYVGHSQGTSIGFIAFSTNQELAKKVKMFYALAPVANLTYTKSLLGKLTIVPEFMLKILFGDKIFMPHTSFDQFLGDEVCSREVLDLVCSNTLFLFCGFDSKNLNMSRFDVYLAHNPAGTSVQDILHWYQVKKAKQFQGYDWGSPSLNMLHHNQARVDVLLQVAFKVPYFYFPNFPYCIRQICTISQNPSTLLAASKVQLAYAPTPPIYNMSDMEVPIAVWNGGNDWLADVKDVDLLLPTLPKLVYHKEITSYNHLDFIWAMNSPQEVYNEIVFMMDNYGK